MGPQQTKLEFCSLRCSKLQCANQAMKRTAPVISCHDNCARDADRQNATQSAVASLCYMIALTPRCSLLQCRKSLSVLRSTRSSTRRVVSTAPAVMAAPSIPHRDFGATGAQVSLIGMGCSPFGHAYGVRAACCHSCTCYMPVLLVHAAVCHHCLNRCALRAAADT